VEKARHHPYDFVGYTIQADHFTQNLGPSPEAPLPKIVTDNDHLARYLLFQPECTTNERLNAHDLKEFTGGRGTTQDFWFSFAGEIKPLIPNCGDALENMVLLFQMYQVNR